MSAEKSEIEGFRPDRAFNSPPPPQLGRPPLRANAVLFNSIHVLILFTLKIEFKHQLLEEKAWYLTLVLLVWHEQN